MEIASFVIAVLALVFSGYTYFAHDKKIREQEIQLNSYQIRAFKQTEEEQQKAKIRGNIIPSRTLGVRILKIFNAGQAVAKNVNVEWLNPDDLVMAQWDFGSIGEISPQNGRQYIITLCERHPETMRLRYTWSDDYNDNNVFEEDVQL